MSTCKSQGEGEILGFFSPLTMHCNAFTAKGIIQSPIMSCSRRDHSIAVAFAANGISREGGDGSSRRGRSVIYDCLVLFVKRITQKVMDGFSNVLDGFS